MKKHLLGILVLLITFGIGFSVSPIRFTVFAVGSSLHGGFTSFESTDFVRVAVTREPQETIKQANIVFENHKKEYEEIVVEGIRFGTVYREILESQNNRALISIRDEDNNKSYCAIKKYENRIYEICSNSKWHVLEFEKQYFE